LLVAKEGPHHSVGQTGMIAEPSCQVIDQRESRLGVSLFDSKDELFHPPARIIVLLFMPAEGTVSDRSHKPFLVSKMLYDASDQAFDGLTKF
jgi:hypothetical protein